MISTEYAARRRDGIDDLIIGAHRGGTGQAYVVFGPLTSFDGVLPLGSLDGRKGFILEGEATMDFAGFSVSGGGDVNADGIDDLVIGAPLASPNATRSGRTYVVFGHSSGFSSPLQLSSLAGVTGFIRLRIFSESCPAVAPGVG